MKMGLVEEVDLVSQPGQPPGWLFSWPEALQRAALMTVEVLRPTRGLIRVAMGRLIDVVEEDYIERLLIER